MSNHVDTIKVELSGLPVGEVYVENFELSVAIGSVPSISLSLLPIQPDKGGSGQFITASAPDIEEMSRLYTELMVEATSLDTPATVKLTVVSDDPDNPVLSEETGQTVTLENWILTDVGLSSLTAVAAPVLTIILHHPSVMLEKSGMIYEGVSNPLNLPKVYSECAGGGLIEFMDDLYAKYAAGDVDSGDVTFFEIADTTFGGTSGEFKEKVRSLRKQLLAEFPPGRYINDRTGGLFMTHICPYLEDSIKESVGSLASPRPFCNSTWERLISELCPYFTTTVVPTYTEEKLLLEPNSPWQKSSYKITTPLITTLDMSPHDPNPLIGAAINKAKWSSLKVVQAEARNDEDNKGTPKSYAFSFYFPDKALGAAYGDILNLGEARMIDNLIYLEHTANKTNEPDLQHAGNKAEDEDKANMDDAFAEAMYLINYRKNCRSTIITTPLFKDTSHEVIYPGRVLTVCDTKTGNDLLNGYIIRLSVRGSAAGGCSTIIDLSHVRPADGRSTFVDEGTENPCYEEQGDNRWKNQFS